MARWIKKLYNYYLSPDKESVRKLHELLGFVPTNPSVFNLAFSHKSYTADAQYYAMQNNERLEFLGDAVLGAVVAEYLFSKYPNQDEGFLTKMRSKIVNRKMLNEIGEKIGLSDFIQYQNSGNKMSRSVIGNSFEALIGAIYLDVGYHRTRAFVIDKILRGQINIERLETYDDNYKSQLLEWGQKNRTSVAYEIVSKKKMDNRDYFCIAVFLNEEQAAAAEDFSKKSAEQEASRLTLEKLGLLE